MEFKTTFTIYKDKIFHRIDSCKKNTFIYRENKNIEFACWKQKVQKQEVWDTHW